MIIIRTRTRKRIVIIRRRTTITTTIIAITLIIPLIRTSHLPYLSVTKKLPQVKVHINGITFQLPSAPPLSQPENVDNHAFCNETFKTNCEEGFCHCTHVLNVEKDSLVELILVDESRYCLFVCFSIFLSLVVLSPTSHLPSSFHPHLRPLLELVL